MKTEIKKIEIQLDKKTITLTADQAKKLKGVLEELFGVKEVVREEHHHHNYPYRWYPYWTSPQPYFTCSDGTQVELNNNTVSFSA